VQAWLRVLTGYHTVPQVAVGFVLGCGIAWAWRHLGFAVLLPTVSAGTSPGLPAALMWTTSAAVAAFAAWTLVKLPAQLAKLRLIAMGGAAGSRDQSGA